MKEEVEKWIKLSEEDFATAKANLKIKKYRFASYLCQQAAEKALKALLLKKTGKIIKIHDLVKLGKKVEIEEKFLESLDKLTHTYVESRYPDTPQGKYTIDETKEDIKIAKGVIKWVKQNI